MDRVSQCCGEAARRGQRAVISRPENDLDGRAREDADARYRSRRPAAKAFRSLKCVATARSWPSIVPIPVGMDASSAMRCLRVAGISIAGAHAVACEGASSRSSEARESGVEGVATGGARPVASVARAPAGWSAPPAADSLYVLRVDRSDYLARPPIPRRDRGMYTFTLVATFRN